MIVLVRNPSAPRVVAIAERLRGRGCGFRRWHDRKIVERARPDILLFRWEGVVRSHRASLVQLDNIRTTVALLDSAIAQASAASLASAARQNMVGTIAASMKAPQPSVPSIRCSQAVAFHLHASARLKRVSVMPASPLSPYGRATIPMADPLGTSQILAGQSPRTSAGTQKWDYLHIDDVAEGIGRGADDGAQGLFNWSSVARLRYARSLKGPDLAGTGVNLRFGEIPFGPTRSMHLEGDAVVSPLLRDGAAHRDRGRARDRCRRAEARHEGLTDPGADRLSVRGGINTLFGYSAYTAMVLFGVLPHGCGCRSIAGICSTFCDQRSFPVL